MAIKTRASPKKSNSPDYLVGHSIDTHNIIPGSGLVIGTVLLKEKWAVVAHSDGDVLLHALSEAIIGALGQGDLGTHFSDKDPVNKNLNSAVMLSFALKCAYSQGYNLSNADILLVSDQIMVANHRLEITETLKKLTGCLFLNLKGTR